MTQPTPHVAIPPIRRSLAHAGSLGIMLVVAISAIAHGIPLLDIVPGVSIYLGAACLEGDRQGQTWLPSARALEASIYLLCLAVAAAPLVMPRPEPLALGNTLVGAVLAHAVCGLIAIALTYWRTRNSGSETA